MKRIVMSASLSVLIMTACASLMGKWSVSTIEQLSVLCLTENDDRKPSTSNWHNLGTKERSKKKKEMDEYKKKRIELYQSIDSFKNLYFTHVDKDGVCRKKECRSLEKFRLLIIAGCPLKGDEFPKVKSE